MSGEPITYVVADRIATATFSRPDAMNSITEEVMGALDAILDRVAEDAGVKALVITGSGSAFCVGLDLGLLENAFADAHYFKHALQRYHDVLLKLEAVPVPTIAAVNGLARAGGFEMMLACDFVVVSEDARIADHHLAFGILPGGGATQRAPRRMGMQRAKELILGGGWLHGAQAVAAGVALRSVPHEQLAEAVDAFAARFRGLSRPALAATKAAINDGAELPLRRALDLEIERFIEHLQHEPTSHEGYRAYVEGREPHWD
ncbi:MAG TPA: enoyl-CoA hydratase/isomerase family protein [Actinomycetota bacterium]